MLAEKNCLYCKTPCTPLWRMGPDGCKTLCNACGIRWRRIQKTPNKKDEVDMISRTPEGSVVSSEDDEPDFGENEIYEVAAKLTRLAEENDCEPRKRKRENKRKSSGVNKKRNVILSSVIAKMESVYKQQEANDDVLDHLHAQLLRQTEERVAVTNLAQQLTRQIAVLEQALSERDETIDELQKALTVKNHLLRQTLASHQDGWQM